MESLGSYIRQLRDERDLSLREFAKKLDVSAPFVSDVELGRRHPSEEVLAKIAQVLGVKVEDLRSRDTRPPIEEIKRITQSDPKFALAFRTMIEKKISADELLNLAIKKESRKSGNKQKK
jgi:transcriptional regulator with XRE-family HTH domain